MKSAIFVFGGRAYMNHANFSSTIIVHICFYTNHMENVQCHELCITSKSRIMSMAT